MSTADDALQTQRRIDHFLACDHGSLLFTSRSRSAALQKLVYNAEIIDVRPMSEEEAEAMLEKKLGQADTYSRELVRALECMPLAVTQAAAYIRERGPRYSVRQYREAIEQSQKSRTSLLRQSVPLPDRDAEASNSILLTWQISFEHILYVKPSAANLLSLMSFCDRLAIPQDLLYTESEQGEQGKQSESFDAFDNDIIVLCNFSFISNTKDRQTWEMHQLVQDATQIWLQDSKKLDEIHNQFIERLDLAFPSGDFENWTVCRSLFPHAKASLGQRPAEMKAQLEWASVMYKSA